MKIKEKEVSRSGFLFRQTAVIITRKNPGSFVMQCYGRLVVTGYPILNFPDSIYGKSSTSMA